MARQLNPMNVSLRKFLINSPGRTGTTYLQMYLNDHPESFCLNEVYHEGHLRVMLPPPPGDEKLFDKVVERMYKEPVRHLDLCIETFLQYYGKFVLPKTRSNSVPKAIGAKIIGEEIELYKELWDASCEEGEETFPMFKQIVLLRRNLTECAISTIISDLTQEWTWYRGNPQYTSNPSKALKENVIIEMGEIETHITTHLEFVELYMQYKDKFNFMHIFYEDLFSVATHKKVKDFLGLEAELYVEPLLEKQNSLYQYQKIANLQEINDNFGKEYGYVGANCPPCWEKYRLD